MAGRKISRTINTDMDTLRTVRVLISNRIAELKRMVAANQQKREALAGRDMVELENLPTPERIEENWNDAITRLSAFLAML